MLVGLWLWSMNRYRQTQHSTVMELLCDPGFKHQVAAPEAVSIGSCSLVFFEMDADTRLNAPSKPARRI